MLDQCERPADIQTQVVCHLATQYYRQQQKVLIYTQDQQLAHQIDEVLWAQDADSFVAHNLAGEGPKWGSPVEIGGLPPKGRRQVLINLTETVPDFAGQFNHIIEFVPADDQQKQLARQRFSRYKRSGLMPVTQPAATLLQTQH